MRINRFLKSVNSISADDLEDFLNSCTPFQLKVYEAVSSIPPGQTRSYKWVAKKIGSPKAYRAVGNALKKNEIPLYIPCHRVTPSIGSIGAYTGGAPNCTVRGGHSIKKRLIEIERE